MYNHFQNTGLCVGGCRAAEGPILIQIAKIERHLVSLIQKCLEKQMLLLKTYPTPCLIMNVQCGPARVSCEIPNHIYIYIFFYDHNHKRPHISTPLHKDLPRRGGRNTGDLSYLQLISIFPESINQFPFGQYLVT